MITALLNGGDLTEEQAEALFARLFAGEMSEVEMTALLVALKMRGETPAVIGGAARAMRAAAVPFDPGMDVADSCGTGGDGCHTLNVSTAVALVTAACGIPMVKHGNRSVSSKCGSADVLEALGVQVSRTVDEARRDLQHAGICFLFAPDYHAGLKHAAGVRRALGVRTILNLLGPLVNPAQPRWQLVGVYDPRFCVPMAETLGRLGCDSALVVHGSGLDEIALHGETQAAFLQYGAVREMTLSPESAGLTSHPLEGLAGGEVETNADLMRDILQGRGDEVHVSTVALNAGALLLVAGRVSDLREGAACALDVLQTDRAWQLLERWKAVQHGAR